MGTMLKVSGTITIIIALVLMSPDINPFGKVSGFVFAILILLCGFGLVMVSNTVDKINH